MSVRANFYRGEDLRRRFHREHVAMHNRQYRIEAMGANHQAGVSDWCNSTGKRCFDVILAVLAILASAPLMVAVAVAVKLTSAGPVLFRQVRAGRHQAAFVIFKFRTMTSRAEWCGPTVTRCGDPRLTPIGGLLRRLKLDELPQLFNVVLGDMSFVGPRPKLRQHEKMYLACRPGITGAATIHFCEEEKMLANVPEALVEQYAVTVFSPLKVQLDQEYLRTASLLTDLAILGKTLLGVSRAAAILDRAAAILDRAAAIREKISAAREFKPQSWLGAGSAARRPGTMRPVSREVAALPGFHAVVPRMSAPISD